MKRKNALRLLSDLALFRPLAGPASLKQRWSPRWKSENTSIFRPLAGPASLKRAGDAGDVRHAGSFPAPCGAGLIEASPRSKSPRKA